MKTFAIALTLLTGCLAGTAHAATSVQVLRQQVVNYADLNLDTQTDAAILFSRIKIAARRVCALSSGASPLGIVGYVQSCAADATARAIADVDAPMLTRHATDAKQALMLTAARGRK